jgi:hypothetical protein
MPEELSLAGADYGRAFCLSPDRASLPFPELSAVEQQCVRTVGLRFQEDVERRLGLAGPPGSTADPPVIQRLQVTGPTGQTVGHVTFADGAVTLCLRHERPTATGQPAKACDLVGFGMDGFYAVQETLEHLGFRTTPAPSPPPGPAAA